MVDGFMILGQYDNPQSPTSCVTMGLSAGGEVISLGPFLDTPADPIETPYLSHGNIVICDATVAFFQNDVIDRYFANSAPFLRALMRNLIQTCYLESNGLLSCRTAKESVRHVLAYCRDHHIPQLTHEQIALVSNRSRPVVTEIMHALISEEPELFDNR